MKRTKFKKIIRISIAILVILIISLLFLVDPEKPSHIYIKKDTASMIKLSGDVNNNLQLKIDFYRVKGFLPAFFRARSPGLVRNWPPIGWVLTADDPINLLVFVQNSSKSQSKAIIREMFKKIGFFDASIWNFGFLTRYKKPIEIEMFYEFTAGGEKNRENLQLHLRGFYGGEDRDFGQIWFFNGHAEYRTSDVIRHVFGVHIPDKVVNGSDFLDKEGVKWESFERYLDKFFRREMGKDYVVIYKGYFNYSNKGYYSGLGQSSSGDKYYYVDGKIPVIMIRAL